jgi:hypothetical protein
MCAVPTGRPAGGAVPSSALGLTSMGTGPNSGWARVEGVHVAYARR